MLRPGSGTDKDSLTTFYVDDVDDVVLMRFIILFIARRLAARNYYRLSLATNTADLNKGPHVSLMGRKTFCFFSHSRGRLFCVSQNPIKDTST